MKKIVSILLVIFAVVSFALSPLKPVKVDSPRDTMESYISAMSDYNKGRQSGDQELENRLNDAVRTFNLEHVPNLTRRETGAKLAIKLKEILDRVILIDLEKIPDDNTLKRWRLKDTEITIKLVESGDRTGEFLFSKQTVNRIDEFYEKVKHLPYLKESEGGAGFEEAFQTRLLPSWAKKEFGGIYRWQWLGILAAIILGLILKGVARFIVSIFQKLTSKQADSKRHRVFLALEDPVGLAVATLFWYICVHSLKFEGLLLKVLLILIQITLSYSLIKAAYRLTDIVADYLDDLAKKTETELDDHLVPMMTNSLKIFVLVIGVLVAIQNLGFNVMSVLAGLGLGGLAFALAAKDTAANLFGSLMILFDRPFKPGDWIVTSDAEGTVESVGFRSTRLRTFYNSLISIPNSNLANQTIDNMGERKYRRIKSTFGLTYDTPPEKIEAFVEGLKEIIKANQYTRKDYYHVVFNGYGDFSLNILFYCFLETPDWAVELVEKQNLYLEILRLAKKLEVEFAFPTQSFHIESTPDKQKPEKQNYSDQELKSLAHEFKKEGVSAKPGGLGIFTPPYKDS